MIDGPEGLSNVPFVQAAGVVRRLLAGIARQASDTSQ
jgi:hypothetical protein